MAVKAAKVVSARVAGAGARPTASGGRTRAARRCAARCAAAGPLDPDNCSVLVVGGAGVGLEVSKALLDDGAWVTAMCRSDSVKKEVEMKGGITVKGDAMDKDRVAEVMASIDDLNVVVSTVGGTPAEPEVDSTGNINLINAAKEAGVQRFVLVTSIGTGDSKDATPPEVYDVLKPVLIEKAKAEEVLRESGMEWVIIRPGGLKSEPATGKGVLTEDVTVCGSITREDVAKLVVRCLWSGDAVGKTLTAIDSEQQFSPAKTFETLTV